VIYDQKPCPLTAAGLRALTEGAVVPLFSPRTATLLMRQVPNGAWERATPLALSPAVAAALPVPARIASTPDAPAIWRLLLETLELSAVEGRARSD
jgi:hypothetical protein